MKILIVGTGAVGGYFGGRLALAGNEVTFLARGRRLAVLKERGLTAESISGDFTLNPVSAIDKTEGIFDLILLTVKAYDLDNAITLIKNNVSQGTAVISLLNGIESEQTLKKTFGSEKIIGGIAFIGSTLLENGSISHTAAGSITIGELTGEKSRRCTELQQVFKSSGVLCKVSETIQTDIWAKMIWNIGFNAVTAITGTSVSDVLESKETESLTVEAMEEARQVAVAENISLPENIVLKTVEKTRKTGAIKTSMLQDIERGTNTEVESLNGVIVQLGDKHGIPVPVNRTLLRLVSLKEKKTRLFKKSFYPW